MLQKEKGHFNRRGIKRWLHDKEAIMSTARERFYRRKQIVKTAKKNTIPLLVPSSDLVNQILAAPVDIKTINEVETWLSESYNFDLEEEPTTEEIGELLEKYKREFDESRRDYLIESARDKVLASVIRPFGLQKILFNDKDGGNVTTIHGAQRGVYAKESEKWESKNSENKKMYQKPYFSLKVKQSMEDYKQQRLSGGKVQDELTGKMLQTNTDRKRDPNAPIVDHIYSRKTFHEKGGYMLTKKQKEAFASDPRNFAITNKRLNDAKGPKDLKVFIDSGDNKSKYDIDGRRAKAKYEQSRKAMAEHLTLARKTLYYSKNIAITGAQESTKMGLQQALGCLLQEVVIAIFAEIKDVYHNGLKAGMTNQGFFSALRRRLNRIIKRVLSKWKDVVTQFGEGAFSAFFSNMVTTIINMFVTTGKRIVRIIREGFFSLIRAIKLLLFPPEGMTLPQAAHEATKLIAGGVVVTGGIIIEEGFEKWLASFGILAPFAPIISPVVVGVVTGLLTVFVVYLLDKIDIFGVIEDERQEYVLNCLDSEMTIIFEKAERITLRVKLI